MRRLFALTIESSQQFRRSSVMLKPNRVWESEIAGYPCRKRAFPELSSDDSPRQGFESPPRLQFLGNPVLKRVRGFSRFTTWGHPVAGGCRELSTPAIDPVQHALTHTENCDLYLYLTMANISNNAFRSHLAQTVVLLGEGIDAIASSPGNADGGPGGGRGSDAEGVSFES